MYATNNCMQYLRISEFAYLHIYLYFLTSLNQQFSWQEHQGPNSSEGYLPGPNFPHRKLPGPDLLGPNLPGPNSQGANLPGAQFSGDRFAGEKRPGPNFPAKNTRGPICPESLVWKVKNVALEMSSCRSQQGCPKCGKSCVDFCAASVSHICWSWM